MIHVLAIITTKPGKRDAVLEIFHAQCSNGAGGEGMHRVRAGGRRPGHRSNPDQAGAGHVRRYREVGEPGALAAHAAAPHMVAYGAKVRDMVASRVIHVLSPG